ncbi:hypothetical protein BO86DRAFT_337918 [Aspergillus japonicus CBS 114.51]|uniref:DUF4604 domain-containing protein n=2 Tax=Aspergillus TaxID=5052 RepID=A0A2V5H230_ASPV1|nr:hypothetical protein BO86DRAFT_337918 [Aspergillus japonicus CBS 114.51]PYI17631.1 hypothetical protein BO99DRAFT_363908 [Aspergillus violaceofuscus CBS 115571]RAH82161.1 hypothetical protein BO86DRAFT_337918 [Aspergillus japonicus CBS 114.51]
MSFKSKDLAYEAKEPAFLQRLRNQYGDNSGRLERPVARPRKPREEHDDDGPTYVDEESNDIISKEEYEALVRGDKPAKADDQTDKDLKDENKSAGQPGEGSKSDTGAETSSSKQNIAEIGGPRKRKQAKVIGEDAPAAESEDTKKKDSSGVRKAKQKKKIKLSFDNES